eukprot:CAMPEP_0115013180 /NCGR_PEP_ID=MMETSP0216-20121206/25237_1 /TAXON_ID=223996 /ORGANISM="Protocruzia adherens, Strain Boccale" /LENGTH=132 /DNA_ID=CAMNT_0002382495 /DNA_START=38 /DNA_END=436 /DNA_ORIENTATION=-
MQRLPIWKARNLHPAGKKLQNQLSSPLPPLKYSLQELPSPDTTMNTPLGGTDHLPFQVDRTHTGNLPVYSDFRNDYTRKLTIVRKLTGDMEEFKKEISKVCSNAPVTEKVGRIEVKGVHTGAVKLWLRRLGF